MKTIKVLFVGEEDLGQEIMKLTPPFKVTTAYNLSTAERKYRKTEFDMVIFGYVLLEEMLFQTIRTFKNERRSCRLVSAVANEALRSSMIMNGCEDLYITPDGDIVEQIKGVVSETGLMSQTELVA
jgi:DNA-binding response OmpR family regulator